MKSEKFKKIAKNRNIRKIAAESCGTSYNRTEPDPLKMEKELREGIAPSGRTYKFEGEEINIGEDTIGDPDEDIVFSEEDEDTVEE